MGRSVTLTHSELVIAGHVGMMRHASKLINGRAESYGAQAIWDPDIEGACGECAAAKALNRYWPPTMAFRDRMLGDLLHGVEVRTRSSHAYDLILHPKDADDRPFILVTGRAPCFEVRGWILGRDGKLQQYWSDPAGGRPAFFVPQTVLHDVESLL
jgi:hypothetical protein